MESTLTRSPKSENRASREATTPAKVPHVNATTSTSSSLSPGRATSKPLTDAIVVDALRRDVFRSDQGDSTRAGAHNTRSSTTGVPCSGSGAASQATSAMPSSGAGHMSSSPPVVAASASANVVPPTATHSGPSLLDRVLGPGMKRKPQPGTSAAADRTPPLVSTDVTCHAPLYGSHAPPHHAMNGQASSTTSSSNGGGVVVTEAGGGSSGLGGGKSLYRPPHARRTSEEPYADSPHVPISHGAVSQPPPPFILSTESNRNTDLGSGGSGKGNGGVVGETQKHAVMPDPPSAAPTGSNTNSKPSVAATSSVSMADLFKSLPRRTAHHPAQSQMETSGGGSSGGTAVRSTAGEEKPLAQPTPPRTSSPHSYSEAARRGTGASPSFVTSPEKAAQKENEKGVTSGAATAVPGTASEKQPVTRGEDTSTTTTLEGQEREEPAAPVTLSKKARAKRNKKERAAAAAAAAAAGAVVDDPTQVHAVNTAVSEAAIPGDPAAARRGSAFTPTTTAWTSASPASSYLAPMRPHHHHHHHHMTSPTVASPGMAFVPHTVTSTPQREQQQQVGLNMAKGAVKMHHSSEEAGSAVVGVTGPSERRGVAPRSQSQRGRGGVGLASGASMDVYLHQALHQQHHHHHHHQHQQSHHASRNSSPAGAVPRTDAAGVLDGAGSVLGPGGARPPSSSPQATVMGSTYPNTNNGSGAGRHARAQTPASPVMSTQQQQQQQAWTVSMMPPLDLVASLPVFIEACLMLTPEEKTMREAFFDNIQAIVRASFSADSPVEVRVHGSVTTGLALTSSDIDLLVVQYQPMLPLDALYTVADALLQVDDVTLLEAKARLLLMDEEAAVVAGLMQLQTAAAREPVHAPMAEHAEEAFKTPPRLGDSSSLANANATVEAALSTSGGGGSSLRRPPFSRSHTALIWPSTPTCDESHSGVTNTNVGADLSCDGSGVGAARDTEDEDDAVVMAAIAMAEKAEAEAVASGREPRQVPPQRASQGSSGGGGGGGVDGPVRRSEQDIHDENGDGAKKVASGREGQADDTGDAMEAYSSNSNSASINASVYGHSTANKQQRLHGALPATATNDTGADVNETYRDADELARAESLYRDQIERDYTFSTGSTAVAAAAVAEVLDGASSNNNSFATGTSPIAHPLENTTSRHSHNLVAAAAAAAAAARLLSPLSKPTFPTSVEHTHKDVDVAQMISKEGEAALETERRQTEAGATHAEQAEQDVTNRDVSEEEKASATRRSAATATTAVAASAPPLFTRRTASQQAVTHSTDGNGGGGEGTEDHTNNNTSTTPAPLRTAMAPVEEGPLYYVQTIVSTRVPVIKVTDKNTGMKADITFAGGEHWRSMQLTRQLVARFPQARLLILFLKYLVCATGIGENEPGGVSSFVIYLLVRHFFNECVRRVVEVLQQREASMKSFFANHVPAPVLYASEEKAPEAAPSSSGVEKCGGQPSCEQMPSSSTPGTTTEEPFHSTHPKAGVPTMAVLESLLTAYFHAVDDSRCDAAASWLTQGGGATPITAGTHTGAESGVARVVAAADAAVNLLTDGDESAEKQAAAAETDPWHHVREVVLSFLEPPPLPPASPQPAPQPMRAAAGATVSGDGLIMEGEESKGEGISRGAGDVSLRATEEEDAVYTSSDVPSSRLRSAEVRPPPPPPASPPPATTTTTAVDASADSEPGHALANTAVRGEPHTRPFEALPSVVSASSAASVLPTTTATAAAMEQDNNNDDDDAAAVRDTTLESWAVEFLRSDRITVSQLFYDFCHYFGCAFNYDTMGIHFDVTGESHVVVKPYMCARRGQHFHMTSPFDPEYDLTARMTNMRALQELCWWFAMYATPPPMSASSSMPPPHGGCTLQYVLHWINPIGAAHDLYRVHQRLMEQYQEQQQEQQQQQELLQQQQQQQQKQSSSAMTGVADPGRNSTLPQTPSTGAVSPPSAAEATKTATTTSMATTQPRSNSNSSQGSDRSVEKAHITRFVAQHPDSPSTIAEAAAAAKASMKPLVLPVSRAARTQHQQHQHAQQQQQEQQQQQQHTPPESTVQQDTDTHREFTGVDARHSDSQKQKERVRAGHEEAMATGDEEVVGENSAAAPTHPGEDTLQAVYPYDPTPYEQQMSAATAAPSRGGGAGGGGQRRHTDPSASYYQQQQLYAAGAAYGAAQSAAMMMSPMDPNVMMMSAAGGGAGGLMSSAMPMLSQETRQYLYYYQQWQQQQQQQQQYYTNAYAQMNPAAAMAMMGMYMYPSPMMMVPAQQQQQQQQQHMMMPTAMVNGPGQTRSGSAGSVVSGGGMPPQQQQQQQMPVQQPYNMSGARRGPLGPSTPTAEVVAAAPPPGKGKAKKGADKRSAAAAAAYVAPAPPQTTSSSRSEMAEGHTHSALEAAKDADAMEHRVTSSLQQPQQQQHQQQQPDGHVDPLVSPMTSPIVPSTRQGQTEWVKGLRDPPHVQLTSASIRASPHVSTADELTGDDGNMNEDGLDEY